MNDYFALMCGAVHTQAHTVQQKLTHEHTLTHNPTYLKTKIQAQSLLSPNDMQVVYMLTSCRS